MVFSSPVHPEAIRGAEQLIRPRIRRTPVVEVASGDFDLPGEERLALKLELLQHAGSFKTRGAFAHLLARAVPGVGVVAASGGNHGAAVAYAARQLNVPATIFVPSVSASAKVERIRSYGANLIIAGERYAEALTAADEWTRQTGALAIHAYDDVVTLLGQGTVALEFEEQQAGAGLDTVLVAVGGGGLIGGMAAWFGERVKVVGVEPESAPTLTMALKAGEPVDAPAGGIAADSLAPRQVGRLMFPIAQAFVQEVVLVEDDAIRAAQHRLWDVLRVVAEPGGAAAMAALTSGRYRPQAGERVGVLVCGGNTSAVSFG